MTLFQGWWTCCTVSQTCRDVLIYKLRHVDISHSFLFCFFIFTDASFKYQNTSRRFRTQVKIYLCCCSVTKLFPTLCNSMDCSPPGSSVHGISQARILKWVAISFFMGSSQPRKRTCISCIGRQILYQRLRQIYILDVHHCPVWRYRKEAPDKGNTTGCFLLDAFGVH